MTTLSPSTFEIHTLPNGVQVPYRDSDHSYWREMVSNGDGFKGKGRLTGVSTVVGPMDWQPDNLMGWAAKLQGEGVAQLAAQQGSLAWLESGESINQALYDHGLTWRQIRDQAGARGTNVHLHALHALANGEQIAFDELTEEERGYAQGIAGFWMDHEPRVLAAEAVVADLELGVAGRLDLMCELRGRRVVLDAKTSRFLSPKFTAQLAGYALLAEASGYGVAEGGVILQVQPDATYRMVEVDLDAEDFLAALQVYRRAGELKKQLRKAEKEADSAD